MEDTRRLINCGECTVQNLHRVSIRGTCVRHGISPGDTVEVYIEIVPAPDAGTTE